MTGTFSTRLIVAFVAASCVASAIAHRNHAHGHVHGGLRADTRHAHPVDHGHATERALLEALGSPHDDNVKVKPFKCGVGDPRLEEYFAETPARRSQQYATSAHPEVQRRLKAAAHAQEPLSPSLTGLARRLQRSGQTYSEGEGGAWLSAQEADDAGLAGGIRIQLVWDAMEDADYDGHCQTVGQQVSTVLGPFTCTEDELLTDDKLDLMRQRTEYAAEYFKEALRVKPVQDEIRVFSFLVNEFELDESEYTDTDLVMIMTARPAAGLNGYARCRQFDDADRCTVGEFNWVPTYLDPATIDSPEAINANRHTALHEMVHVLGGIGPDNVFRKADGSAEDHSALWINDDESAGYPKASTKLKSPKVLAWAREHFGCPELDGLAIEDQATGKVAHWEARLLGPELMSYGTGTGETIFGDVTFAYLEDTRQYVANYSRAGRLVGDFGDSGQDFEWDLLVEAEEDFVPPHVRPPGFLRWGYHLGCDFVQGNAINWPDNYFCKENKVFDCTHDNRMSGVCAIANYNPFPTDQFTCGSCTEANCGSTTCTATLNDNPLGDGTYGLPSMYQYFADAAAAKAALKTSSNVEPSLVGGYMSALDFVPVRHGYWNCQDSQASNGTGAGAEGGGLSTESLTEGSTDEMKLFGGQAYCPDCRCMKSSLMDFTSGQVDSDFTTYGLCYRTNCVSLDQMQFAIESQRDGGETAWYGCPKEGGKLYIAGFSGSIRCPVASDFCQFETITGLQYQETDPFWEWFLLGMVALMPLLIAICCLLPCLRNYCISRAKKWCGVNHFDKDGVLDLDAEVDADVRETAPPAGPARILKCVNGIVALLAFVCLALVVVGLGGKPSIAAFLLGALSASTLLFAAMGYMAGRNKARGVSCAPVIYLYVVFFAFIFWLFAALYAMAFPSALGKTLQKRWPMIATAFPDGVLAPKLSDGEADKLLADNAMNLAIFYIGLGTLLFLQLGATIKIVTLPIVAASFYTVCNWMLLVFGLGQWAIAAYANQLAESLPEIKNAVAGFGVMGAWWVFTSIFGIVASHKKTVKWLGCSMAVTCLSVILTLALSAVVFLAVDNVDTILEGIEDDDLARATSALGLTTGSRDDIAEGVRNNLRSLGLFGICVMLCMLVMLVTNAFFVHKVRMYWKAVEARGGQPGRSGGRKVTPQAFGQ